MIGQESLTLLQEKELESLEYLHSQVENYPNEYVLINEYYFAQSVKEYVNITNEKVVVDWDSTIEKAFG